MSRREVSCVLLACMGLWPAAGCLSTPAVQIGPTPLDGAEPPTEKKPELPPQSAAKVNLTVAESLDRSGHAVDAVVLYEKARQADPSLQRVGRRLAVLYDRLGETERALAEYRQALKATPHDANLLNSFGYFFYTRGRWAEAEEQFRAALHASAKHQRAWINLGMTLAQEQRYPESLEAFAHAVGKAEAQSNLAFILTAQGKREEARQAYRQALALDPNLAIARLALAKLDAPPQNTTKERSEDARKLTSTHEPPLAAGGLARSDDLRRIQRDEERLVPMAASADGRHEEQGPDKGGR